MKSLLTLTMLFVLSISMTTQAQDFDSNLKQQVKDFAAKLSKKNIKKVAVWGFLTESGKRTKLSDFLTDDVSVYLTNSGDDLGFEVIDRKRLDAILAEHKLNAEGFIDPNTAKELGKIIAVDAIITGTYSILDTKLKVRLTGIDTETASQISANMSSIATPKSILDMDNDRFGPGGQAATVSKDPMCAEEQRGDLCFENTTDEKMVVKISHFKSLDTKSNSRIYETLFVDPGDTKCSYNMYNRAIDYYIATWSTFQKELEGVDAKLNSKVYMKYLKDVGQIKIETCQAKTFTIK